MPSWVKERKGIIVKYMYRGSPNLKHLVDVMLMREMVVYTELIQKWLLLAENSSQGGISCSHALANLAACCVENHT